MDFSLVLAGVFGAAGLAIVAQRILAARTAEGATMPGSKWTDAELGTLPQVPGLMALEAKEPGFARELLTVFKETEVPDGDKVASLISEESGFKPSAGNPNGGATGLMQWLPSTAPIVGTTVDAIRAMTGIQQVRGPIKATLKLWGKSGRADPPMAGWGNHHGQPDDFVIARQGVDGNRYEWNKVYDSDKKGFITTGDVRRAVYRPLESAKGKPRVGADGKLVV